MAEYNMVKFCYMCKKRYVVPKSDSKKVYCDTCQARVDKERLKQQQQEVKP